MSLLVGGQTEWTCPRSPEKDSGKSLWTRSHTRLLSNPEHPADSQISGGELRADVCLRLESQGVRGVKQRTGNKKGTGRGARGRYERENQRGSVGGRKSRQWW